MRTANRLFKTKLVVTIAKEYTIALKRIKCSRTLEMIGLIDTP